MIRRSPVLTFGLRHLRIAMLIALFLSGMQSVGVPGAMAAREVTDVPGAVVLRFHAALLSVMQNADRLGYKGRYAKLQPEIRKSYDLPLLARLVIGDFWRKLNRDQRVQFVHVFSHLVIATYASRFDGYSGEKFSNVSERRLDRGDVLIDTRLSQRHGKVVHLNYILRQSGGQWRIINVISNGASDLALKRADYGSVLRNQGFKVLIGRLEDKIAQYQ